MTTGVATLTDRRSAGYYGRARTLIPGGVNSPVRAMRSIGRDPLFIHHASKAEIVDVDGNAYIDYVCSWGPLILGHAHPRIVEAVTAAAQSGMSFGAPTVGEIELSQAICARVPSIEMVRMTSSGTEAAMTAIRLARAATKRNHVLKFIGGYHGHVDSLLVSGGSGLATTGRPSSAGIDQTVVESTILADFNDIDAVQKAFADHEFAAVIIEPIPANTGLIIPAAGFLEELRQLCDASGTVLIFDEVISGFRIGPGGAQEYTGVLPDLTLLGKIIGGGVPAAAVGGRCDLMERLSPVGDVYQAGTLSGNPLAVAAGLATLAQLDNEAYAQLAAITSALAQGLREAGASAGVPVSVVDLPGLLTVFFTGETVVNHTAAVACDHDAYGAWCRGLLARGVYPPPSQYEAWFPSVVHSDAQVAHTVEAAYNAFADLS